MAASAGSVAIAGQGTPRFAVSPYALLVLPLLTLLLTLYAYPLVKVLWISFSDPELGFGNYEKLITAGGIRRMLFTTFKICTITSFFAMLFGYVVAYAMTHVGERHRLWMMLFVLVPFWVSVLARAFSWVTLLGDKGIVNDALIGMGLIGEPLSMMRNQLGVLIGMVHYMVPYAVLPLYAAMRGIDMRVVSAARGLGAGPFEAFWRVFLPLSLPGIVAAGMLVFILTLGFFVTPAVLGGGKTIMIAEYISAQILNIGRWGVGAMCATVLLVLVFLVLGVMSRFVDLRSLFGAK